MWYFGMGSVVYCVKWSFGLFQRVALVLMSPSSHVDMFQIHSQRSMHCRTSVVMSVAKCIFCVALGKVCCITVALRISYCSCLLSDQCCVVDCLSVWSWSSFVFVHLSFTDPTLSLIRKFHSRATWLHLPCLNCALHSLNPQALTLPLGITHCAITVLKFEPLNPSTVQSPNLFSCKNCALGNLKHQALPWALEPLNYVILFDPGHPKLHIAQSQASVLDFGLWNCAIPESITQSVTRFQP